MSDKSPQPRNVFEWSKAYFRSEDRSLHETKATMAALMTYADFHDRMCYPSQRTLARITGTHVDTVRRHIKKNIEAGWLVKVRDGNSRTTTNKYLLTVPTPCTGAGSTHTPSTATGSTPRTEARSDSVHGCTPNYSGRTNQGTTQQSGSMGNTSDPFGSEGDYVPVNQETNQQTPRTDAGSSPGTHAGSLDGMVSLSQSVSRLPADDPFAISVSDEEEAEQRLLAALADGTIPAKSAQGVMRVPTAVTNAVVPRLIRSGVVIHDTDAKTLSLA